MAATAPPVRGRPLALVCNPLSGRVQSRLRKVRSLGEALAGTNYREASSPRDIAQALSTLPLAVDTCLGVVGGDGTVQAVLTALHMQRGEGDWPTLFVAPGGSTNMTAKDLGASSSVLRALERLNGWYKGDDFQGSSVRRAVLCVDREGEDPVCGMFFGLGLIAEGVQFFRDHLRGHAYAGEHASWLSVGRVMLSFGLNRGRQDPREATMTKAIDGGAARRHDCALCLTTTLNRLLLGSRPYWGRGPDPLHFTLVEAGAAGIWRNLLRFARGHPGQRLNEGRGYFSQNASFIELSFEGPFVVDGELYTAAASEHSVRLTAPHMPNWLVL